MLLSVGVRTLGNLPGKLDWAEMPVFPSPLDVMFYSLLTTKRTPVSLSLGHGVHSPGKNFGM